MLKELLKRSIAFICVCMIMSNAFTAYAKESMAVSDDPQSGTSMSNTQEDVVSIPRLYVRSRSSSLGSGYTHNSRYNSGYDIINGIDVSSHNGTVNWSAVKASGVEYAMIRVGYRGYGSSGSMNEDTKYKENIKGALNAGMKVGVYFFSQATSRTEAVEEADFVLERISNYKITLPVVIDFEYANGNTGRLYDAHLSRDKATTVCKSFCKEVESEGYTAMVYANKSMLENNLEAGELSSRFKVWLAHYTTKSSYAGDYYAWQYSSQGSINGINGNVDCNFFYEKRTQVTNPENAEKYVNKLFEVLLERKADTSGLNTYASALVSGQSTASDVALTIMSSSEFSRKNYSDSDYVSKLYQALLGRNGSLAEISSWEEKIKVGVSRRYVLIQIVNSNEFTNVCNGYQLIKGSVSVTESRDRNYAVTAYVAKCYQNILGRTADVSGLNTWTEKILSGYGGAEIVKDLVMSKEFVDKRKTESEFVEILYHTMLGRNADASGKQYWVKFLEEGVSYAYIINGFSGSKEFGNICSQYGISAGKVIITEARDKNIGVTSFVSRNYRMVLGRNGEADGLNNWCLAILNKTKTPAEVAYEFVFSEEAVNKNLNDTNFVDMLYGVCLDRKADSQGLQYWTTNLHKGMSRETVFWGFANSPEFQKIIRGYGL